MPQWQHEYTVREWAPELEPEFEAFAALIREAGEIKPWPRSAKEPRYRLSYLTIADWEYWTMGEPIVQTSVINRAHATKVT